MICGKRQQNWQGFNLTGDASSTADVKTTIQQSSVRLDMISTWMADRVYKQPHGHHREQ